MTKEEILDGLYEIKNWKCNGDSKMHEVVTEAIKALEQEPTTKNDLGVETTTMIDKSNFSQEQYKADLQSAYDCGYEQAKNDLGVDCASRILVQSAISKSIEYKENPYQLYKRIDRLPSVTPQEPKTGHWIIKDDKEQGYDIGGVKTWYIQIMCSECGFIKNSNRGSYRTVSLLS